jgi:hypothetical protein
MIDEEKIEFMSTPTLTEEEHAFIFKRLGEIDGIDSLLKLILKQDMVLYFNVPPENQQAVRGGYNRTKWILDEIRKTRITPEEALKKFNTKKKYLTKKR